MEAKAGAAAKMRKRRKRGRDGSCATACSSAMRSGRPASRFHRYLKHGHLEKVYENALAHRLRKAGVGCEATTSARGICGI